jgi:hypothetical protein
MNAVSNPAISTQWTFWAAVAVLTVALCGPVAAQPVETQKTVPPAPSTTSPEYAPPPPKSPTDRPAVGPTPGSPALAPGQNAVDQSGRPVQAAGRRTILGLSPMTALWVGLGVVGVVVLVLSAMVSRPARAARRRAPPDG